MAAQLQDIQLIIFDIDGTLIESREAIVRAFEFAFTEMECGVPARKTIVDLIGVSLEDIFRQLLPEYTAERGQQACEFFRAEYDRVSDSLTTVLPGVEETLAWAAQNFMVSTATGKREDYAGKIIADFGWSDLFAATFGHVPGRASKPSPEIVLHNLAHFGVAPEHAVMIGDSHLDIGAGVAAGVHTIGVTTGAFDKNHLLDAGAEIVVDSLDQIIQLIG